MFRKIFIVLLMTPLIIAAAVTDTSFPVLLMISLFLIAVMESSTRAELPD